MIEEEQKEVHALVGIVLACIAGMIALAVYMS